MERHPPAADLNALLGEARWLRGLAAHLIRGAGDADDLMQDTWLQALRSPPTPDRPARPWLGQVLHNAWRMAARTSTRRRAREQAVLAEPAPAAASAEQVLERAQLQRQLAELVMALDEPYRTAILLHYYEGRTSAEIAGALDVPAGTIRWRINQGLSKLRTRLDDDERSWRLVLLPLAGPDSAPRAPVQATGAGLKVVFLTAGAAVVLVSGAALWLKRPASPPPPAPRAAITRNTPNRSITPREEKPMTQTRLNRAIVFFGVALPALVAAAEEGKPLSRDEAVAFCVEFRERTVVCKEELSYMFADMVAPGTSGADKERIRQKSLKEIEDDGTGPLEPRRAKCAASIDRWLSLTHGEVKATRACMDEKDCKKSVACLRPLFEAKHKRKGPK